MKELLKSLNKVVSVLAKEGIPYQIGGSMLLYAHGIETTVHDIDLLFDFRDFEKVASLFSKEIEKEQYSKGNYLTKAFLELEIDEVLFDFMFDFGIDVDGFSYQYPFTDPDGTRSITMKRKTYSFSRLEEWYLVYLMMNNRVQKANMIRSHFIKSKTLDDNYIDSMLKRDIPLYLKQLILNLQKDCAK